MDLNNFVTLLGESSFTSLGFFWKACWAFVLGYLISSMIQVFIPKGNLTPYMGKPNLKSISIATVFGSASSSCSFAALAAARSLFLKGVHFISTVAFMFASTNLVIELGILILIFLGWQFLAAEIIGGLLLIFISSILIKFTYPREWINEAREKVQQESTAQDESFNWKDRITSTEGWYMVGHKFVMEWKMVWEDILIGFTIAGVMAVFVPESFWTTIFLNDYTGVLPEWLIKIENAIIAPFVAAMTFIGSMGNIPLATVLNANGVLFAGIMGFIYSDLMVPPLVRVNSKYYGWKIALYIAFVMFISIVMTAFILDMAFSFLGLLPESGKAVSEVVRFKFDYTFWMNLFSIALAAILVVFHKKHMTGNKEKKLSFQDIFTFKKIIIYVFVLSLISGLAVKLF